MLQVTLMGSFSATLHDEGGARTLSLSRRGAELLALLALSRGRFFQRAELGQLIGAGNELDVSPEAISTAVWRLRRAIEDPPVQRGDYFVKNRHGAIGLNGPGRVSLDVLEFEQLARGGLGERVDDTNEARVPVLRAAQALYKDCLLPGFSTEWVLRERERLRRTHLDVLYRLMHIDAARRNYAGAIEYAQQILSTDSMREDVHRALMQYFVSNGQRALALRQFEICRTALKRELAIQPMRETIALYQKISDAAAEMPSGDPGDSAARSKRHTSEVTSHLAAARALIAEADSHLHDSIDLMDR